MRGVLSLQSWGFRVRGVASRRGECASFPDLDRQRVARASDNENARGDRPEVRA